MAKVTMILTHPEGLERALLEQTALLDVALEDQHAFTSWAVDVVENRIPPDSIDRMIVAHQYSPESRLAAQRICNWFVDEIRSVIHNARLGTGLQGPIFLDRWTTHGDLLLAHHEPTS